MNAQGQSPHVGRWLAFVLVSVLFLAVVLGYFREAQRQGAFQYILLTMSLGVGVIWLAQLGSLRAAKRAARRQN